MPATRAVYRLLLLACPPDVRRSIGPEMADVFAHCLAVERRRHPYTGTARAWMRGIADVLTFAVAARRDRRRVALVQPSVTHQPRRRLMMRHDIRAAIRTAAKQPFFTAMVVLMFAVGIGATTAIFSVVHGVLLEALPFPHPDTLVEVEGMKKDRGWGIVSLTEANMWDIGDMNHVFASFGGFHDASFTLTGFDYPERLEGATVTAGFFDALGVRPVAGRVFRRGEDARGGPRIAVLGHAFWIRQYGGDPAVVGRSLTLDGRPAEIVGVLPAGSPWLDAADVFVPLERRSDPNRGSFEYSAIGRLKPGVTLAAATADLNRVAEELERRYPKDNTGLGIAALPSQSWVASDDLRRTLWILLGACGLLLLIACANVTNLQLVRGTARAHESALRTALGARRFDLVRERLVEAVLYGIAGAAIGLPLALGAIRWLRWLAPPDVPRIDRVSLDVPVFLFAAGIGVLAGILTGLISASSTPFGDVAHVLRGQRGAVGDRRLGRVRSLLVAAEVGISLVLLIGAGLLARSLTQVLTTDRGFQAAGRMLLTVSLPASYDEGRLETTARTLLERVRHLPDVLDAAMVSTRPLTNASTGLGIGAADHATDSGTAVPWATWRIVSEGYFKTIGLPLLAGRDFSDVDQLGRPWRVVVSKRVADLLWPGENAVGRHIVLWKGQESVDGEIIGVVGNMRERGLDADPTLAVYFPARGNARTTIQLAVHTRREPADVVPSIRAAIGGVDANLPVSDVRTLASLVDASVATRQLTMMLFGVFAGVALVLALAGVYGVLAYAVTRRTSEIGVRLALGAEGGSVLRLIVAQGLRPVIAGIACGLAAMLFLSRLMANLLFGVTPRDPATYALVGLAFAVVAAAACYIPARRVLAVDPVRALRIE